MLRPSIQARWAFLRRGRFVRAICVINLDVLEIEQITDIAVEVVAETFDDSGFIFTYIVAKPTCHGMVGNIYRLCQVFEFDPAIDLPFALLDQEKQLVFEDTLFSHMFTESCHIST